MKTMHRVVVAAAMSAALALGGCGPEGPTKADTGLAVGAIAGGLLGNTVGKGGGRAAATIVGAVVGGIVGSEIGRSMDEQDRRLAQRAEYDAFESGDDGRPVHWRNPDNGRYGDVVPMKRYRRGEYDCRDYTHTVYIDGRPRKMRGTACRNPDGSWRNVG
jgi:surface antigen